MKNRIELAKHFAELGFKIGAEIGVFEGYFSKVLCDNIPGLKLYCIDNWREFHNFKKYDTTVTALAGYNCEIIVATSMNAVKTIKDNLLDFVYIDADHRYEYVAEDIREWTKKVRIGGIVSGHDYYKMKSGNDGVIKAVDEYIKEKKYTFQRTRIDRSNPYKDDRQPSWYFVKTHE